MRSTMLAVAAVAALSLTGCSPPSDGRDTVAATVAGHRITVGDLEAEMRVTGVAKPDDPAVRRAALERMITRKLLAQAARESKSADIDRARAQVKADALRARAIAQENLDASLDRTAAFASVTPPSEKEVAAFIAAHPEMFANRTIYLLDQIRTASPLDAAGLQALGPVKTLEEAETVLTDRQVGYRRAPAAVDSLRTPELSIIMTKLPPGEVFVLPEGGGTTINVIRSSQARPVTGPSAVAVARGVLIAQRGNDALRSQLKALKAAKVTYGPGFAPPGPEKK